MKILFLILVMLVVMSASAQWQPDVRLTYAPEISYITYNNAWGIAADGNEVHTVWYDFRDNNNEIYYKKSTDGGINWGTDTRLTNNSAWSTSPTIVLFGVNVHIVWYDRRDGNSEIYYKRSTDKGITWGSDIRLTNNNSVSEFPSLANSGSNLHVVWHDDRDSTQKSEIYYKNSTDVGINWGVDKRLTNDFAYSGAPSLAVSNTNIHVVWYDERDGNWEIYYKRSTDSGISWGIDKRLTNNTDNSWVPSIAVSGLNVHIVWREKRDGNWEIYYKRSSDSGINWGADTRLTNNSAGSYSPSIAISGSLVHVVWNDQRDGNWEIYYKLSTNAGVSWGADTRLTNNIEVSEQPCVAVSGSNVHIVWHDYRDSYTAEIYYKRNPTGNVGIQNISTETPSAFSLSQNYPNPFNPVTKINFSIVSSPRVVGADLVQLKVYEVMGREVQTLVNESLKPGTYEVSFDGTKLNSGVYFYKLISGGSTETKKMLMIK